MRVFNENVFFQQMKKAQERPVIDCNVNPRDVQIVLLTLSETLDEVNVTSEHRQLIKKLKEIVVLADGNHPDYRALFFQAYDELIKSEKKPDLLTEIQKKFNDVIAEAQMHYSKNDR